MKLMIGRTDDSEKIAVVKDFSDCEGPAEVAQILLEMEILKQELIEIYLDVTNSGERK